MLRVLALLCLLFVSSSAFAQAGPNCLYYAINSSNATACKSSLAEAEAFIRADSTGQNPQRKLLELTSADPSDGGVSTYTELRYSVRPFPATVGAKAFKAGDVPGGASSSYISVACDVSGATAKYIEFGPMSNCSNTPNLCTYNNYCISQSTVIDEIIRHQDSASCKQGTSVSVTAPVPGEPLSSNPGAPDDRPIYPANVDTLRYYGAAQSNGSYIGGKLKAEWQPEPGCGGNGDSITYAAYAAAPISCPDGMDIQTGDPPLTTVACHGTITSRILAYKPPNCGSCSDMYGNPVVASTGAKIQKPVLWRQDDMLGLSLTYNSLTSDLTFQHLGGGWNSELTSRFTGANSDSSRFNFTDPEGNIQTFLRTSNGVFRGYGDWQNFLSAVTTPKCERSIYEEGRRRVYSCEGNDRHLIRIEYPDAPQKNLSFTWSYDQGFDANGNEVTFYGVHTMVERADGRRLYLFYSRINTAADCVQTSDAPYTCNAVRLSAISDMAGRITLFDYNAHGRLDRITYPDGVREHFEYGAAADICHAGMPGACSGAASPLLARTLLTGVYVEVPQPGGGYAVTREGTYQYDNLGRAIATTHPEEAGRTEFRYAADGTPKVRTYIDASEYREREIVAQRVAIYNKPKTVTERNAAGTVLRTASNIYGSNGFISQATDFRGVRTDYTYNYAGLVTQEVMAANYPTAPRRTIQTDWDVTKRLVTETRLYSSAGSVPGVLVSVQRYAYNSRRQRSAVCLIDPNNAAALAYVCGSSANAPTGVRQARWIFCEPADVVAGFCANEGFVRSVDGPRTDISDITSYDFYTADAPNCSSEPTGCAYRKGDLWKATNALGQISEYTHYDAIGRPLSMKDANGGTTDFEYDLRGRLTALKARGDDNYSEADDSITRIDYDSHGNVFKTTAPDGSFVEFGYDDAHRLTSATDSSANSIHYELNRAGHRVAEEIHDAGNSIVSQLSRSVDVLGRIQSITDATSHTSSFTYDADGNLDTATDPLSRVNDNAYDALGRLTQAIANANGTGNETATTGFQYDAQDRLIGVTDPKGLVTSYGYNGLGDLTQLSSPDTGITTHAYDNAGNRISTTDARGITGTYSYDVLGRLTGQTLPDTTENVTLAYDTAPTECASGETFSLGRLSQITDESGATKYCYDRRGNLVRRLQSMTGGSTYTVGASYDAAGRMTAMTYPSGAIVTWLRDANGRINRVDAVPVSGGTQATVVSSAAYLPFGPMTQLIFGNGRVLDRSYDQNYAPTGVADDASSQPLTLGFSLNAVGNITGIAEHDGSGTVNRDYAYDGLDRLTTQSQGGTTLESFGYDATGNRTSKNGTAYAYPAASHRLQSVGGVARSYDDVGNTLDKGAQAFVYNDRDRLEEFKPDGTTSSHRYRYNGKGERVRKDDLADALQSRDYVYDEAGHLIGEYTLAGERIKEYVWLDDQLVAVLSDHDGTLIQYVETDHLGTPRRVLNPGTNETIWRWDLNGTAFGEHAPSENPDGDALAYTFNLRYPGQYFDAESGQNYNYFRDYEPGTGRYVQSDPIGLRGGVSTYAYAGGRPVQAIDPLGLTPWRGRVRAIGASAVIFGATKFEFELTSDCYFGYRWHVSASILAEGVGLGIGGKAKKLPPAVTKGLQSASAGWGNVVFDDQWSNEEIAKYGPDHWEKVPELFNDSFIATSFGPTLGTGLFNKTMYQFGGRIISVETSGDSGFDLNVFQLLGGLSDASARKERCECQK